MRGYGRYHRHVLRSMVRFDYSSFHSKEGFVMKVLLLTILTASLTMSCAIHKPKTAHSTLQVSKNTLHVHKCTTHSAWHYRIMDERSHYIFRFKKKQPVLIIAQNNGTILVLHSNKSRIPISGHSAKDALIHLIKLSLNDTVAKCLQEII